jgi:hypothetical protein
MEFIGGLIPLIIIVAIIAAVISAFTRRRSHRERGAPGGSARQAFLYLFSFAALMVTAAGGSLLVNYIVDKLRADQYVSGNETQLALGIALTVVGTPAWLLVWRKLWKGTATASHERKSDVRGFYIYLVELISIGFVIGGSVSLIQVILGDGSLEGTDIAFPLIWGVVWGYHWWVETRLTPDERIATPFRTIYVYMVSLSTMALLLSGAGIVMFRLLDSAYAELFISDRLLEPELWGGAMRSGIALGLVGAVGWWWHWFQAAGHEPPTLGRQLYNYIYGVLGGVTTVVISLSILLVIVLQWAFDTPTISAEAEHFRQIVGLIPALLAGIMLWRFHAAVVTADVPGDDRLSAERIYRNIVSGLSLATLSVGLMFLVALFISAASREAQNYIVDEKGWQGQLSIVIPVLAVGGALWGYHWMKLQRLALESVEEIASASRRVHIYSVFGISALTVLGSLSAAVFLVLQAILDEDFSARTFRDVQWPVAILVTTALVSGYYWTVIREDRRRLAGLRTESGHPEKHVTLLLPEAALPVADEIVRLLGYDIIVWAQVDGVLAIEPSQEELAVLVQQIDTAPGDRALVLVDAGNLRVRAYYWT